MILAGGGTGGHIFPAIAIANAIKKLAPQTEILFVGAKGKMEMEKIPQAGYKIEGLDIAGFDRSSLIRNIGLPFKLIRSFWQVRKIMAGFSPDAVIGVGGYSSFPVLKYAQTRGIPTFIHESNSFAGKSNILLGKNADRVFVATDGMEKFFPKEKLQITGNPVRSTIVNSQVSREEALRFFQLDPAKKTVLVTGGSLGARGINEAIAVGLPEFEKAGVQLIWQTGKPFAPQAQELCNQKPLFWTGDFIARMEMAFAAADVVVSRSGAMAIAELCVVGKPAVFVPFPFAAEDHQTVNAQQLVNKSAALMIRDADAVKELVPAVLKLIRDEAQCQRLATHLKQLAITNADQQVAETIVKRIGA